MTKENALTWENADMGDLFAPEERFPMIRNREALVLGLLVAGTASVAAFRWTGMIARRWAARTAWRISGAPTATAWPKPCGT